MNLLPKSVNENIVTQTLEKEILIYDLKMHKAYMLNDTLKKVYESCDGKTSFGELKTKYKFADEIIYLALEELKKQNLIEQSANYISPFTGMSRREIIRRVGMASMIALPVISSLVAPAAADAASGCINSGGQSPNTVVRVGAFIGCFADCSSPTVTSTCCSNSARISATICDPGPPERTTCLCN